MKLKTRTAIYHAIGQSETEDRTVAVRATLADVEEVAATAGYEVDWSEELDGTIKAWGWTDATADNVQDWTLSCIAVQCPGCGGALERIDKDGQPRYVHQLSDCTGQ